MQGDGSHQKNEMKNGSESRESIGSRTTLHGKLERVVMARVNGFEHLELTEGPIVPASRAIKT